jgi:hypothetical protein
MTFPFPQFMPSSVFNPLSLSPLAYWDISNLDSLYQDTAATTPVTASGQSVARVNDLSGNGYHLLQSSSGNRPLYQTGSGFASLQFSNASSRYLKVATPAFPISTVEVYILAKATGVTAYQGFLTWAPTSGNDYNHPGATTLDNDVGGYGITIEENGGVYHATGNSSSLGVIDFNRTPSLLQANLNGSSILSVGSPPTLNATHGGDFLVGARYLSGAPSGFLNGNIYEIALFNTTQTSGNRALLRTCLGAKGGLTI